MRISKGEEHKKKNVAPIWMCKADVKRKASRSAVQATVAVSKNSAQRTIRKILKVGSRRIWPQERWSLSDAFRRAKLSAKTERGGDLSAGSQTLEGSCSQLSSLARGLFGAQITPGTWRPCQRLCRIRSVWNWFDLWLDVSRSRSGDVLSAMTKYFFVILSSVLTRTRLTLAHVQYGSLVWSIPREVACQMAGAMHATHTSQKTPSKQEDVDLDPERVVNASDFDLKKTSSEHWPAPGKIFLSSPWSYHTHGGFAEVLKLGWLSTRSGL